jgi:hypothetical protein
MGETEAGETGDTGMTRNIDAGEVKGASWVRQL